MWSGDISTDASPTGWGAWTSHRDQMLCKWTVTGPHPNLWRAMSHHDDGPNDFCTSLPLRLPHQEHIVGIASTILQYSRTYSLALPTSIFSFGGCSFLPGTQSLIAIQHSPLNFFSSPFSSSHIACTSNLPKVWPIRPMTKIRDEEISWQWVSDSSRTFQTFPTYSN